MNQTPIPTSGRFRPATDDDKLRALALLAALPSQTSYSQTELDTRKAAYMIALENVTAWGLEAATTAILQGSLEHRFMPSASELASEIRRIEDAERERVYRAAYRRHVFNQPIPKPEPPLTEEQQKASQEAWLKLQASREQAAKERWSRQPVSEQRMEEIKREIRAKAEARGGRPQRPPPPGWKADDDGVEG
jgi:hypothetical protein